MRPLLSLGGIFCPPFGFINGFKHSTILCLFLAVKDFRWARWRLTSLFFPGIFYIFLKFSLFFTDFFFLPQQVKLSLSTQPWEPWTFLLQRTFPVAPYMQSWIPYLIEFLIHFFFCWFEDFFFLEALWLDFLLLWMPPFCSPHNLCFFWRGYSVLVLLRDNICIFLFGAQFCYPGQSFASLPLNMHFDTVAFFLANHCEIWLSMALYFGSTSASGQLPTYPSPNPTTVYW